VFDIIEEILLQPEFKRIPPKLFSGIETAVTRVFGARS
jgi:hypothetical protein